MNISYFSDTEAMSQRAAEIVLEEVRQNPNALLCTATGNSPTKLYQSLAQCASLFEKTRIIPLDEWVGLPTLEGSCHAYIHEHILKPLNISEERYFGFNTNVIELEEECNRIHTVLEREGPIDICTLGLGKNGHLGFNEPAEELQAHCHIANLAIQSQDHSMIGSSETKPTQGLTLGMQDILAAKKILLLVSGEGKQEVTKYLLSGTITNDCPASWLWKHDNVHCLLVN
ncbi:galactosamine-6-phosphate isomerase [Maribacter sp. 2308TA10-17]|uniref:galactosamine-6-phosphate isomerase n=1 Tax=Maribacter sp. 2308TA10-17 TaxID=3386276 RepID=UPI0039BC57C2